MSSVTSRAISSWCSQSAVAQSHHGAGALLRRNRSPCRLRLARRARRGVDVGGAGERDQRRQLAGRRVAVLERAVGGRLDPAAADVVAQRACRGFSLHRGTTTPSRAISVSMWTCLVSWKASRPSRPSSRPSPDCLKPPNGPASLSVSGSLNQTVPGLDLAHAAHASSSGRACRRWRRARSGWSWRARSPRRATRTGTIGATGPKVSSRSRSVSAGAPVTTAGAKKWPRSWPAVAAADDDLGAGGDRRLDLVDDLLRAGAAETIGPTSVRGVDAGRRARSAAVWSTNACR